MCCWQQQTGVGIVNGMQIYENIPRAQSQFLEKELVALPSLYCQRFSSSEEGTVHAMCERRSRGTDVWVCLPGASCSSYSLFLWRRWWQICAASCKAVVILELVAWATVRQCVSWYWNRNHDNETDQSVWSWNAKDFSLCNASYDGYQHPRSSDLQIALLQRKNRPTKGTVHQVNNSGISCVSLGNLGFEFICLLQSFGFVFYKSSLEKVKSS